MRFITLDNPYIKSTFLAYGCTHREFIAYINQHHDAKEEYEFAVGTVFQSEVVKGVKAFYIWIDQSKIKKKQRVFLVHELMHLVHALMDYVGMELNDETDEAYAYLQDSFYEQITNHLKL